MLLLDVPFVPDGDYASFLAVRRTALNSVHFSIHDPALADARQRMEDRSMGTIIKGLAELGDIPKYVLMNARLHAPDKYFSADELDATGERLAMLVDTAGINGLVFSDPYFLQALSDAHPGLAGKLEAVPSVNALLDSADRVFAMLDMIDVTEFRQPTKLVLDRSLNRDIQRLTETSERIRHALPAMKLHLIANEGCLYQCPYKLAHDGHIAMVNEGLCGERTFAMNRDLGCVRRLLAEPGTMLASPFIRPEDTAHYAEHIDGIKLCGRNRGTDFLKRVVTAYMEAKYTGNLLDLMDAMGDLSDRVDLPNEDLPDNFFERVTTCDKACRTCGWCANQADEFITRTDPGLPRLEW
ncbi:hypothetical protein OAN24_00310 [Pseudodesulfovibrio sp.]|nr:hypothetical protein [Pseudodesulfovibrio sp.]